MMDILKAFNGRWRIKGFDDDEVRQLSGRTVKDMCYDFFKTAFLLQDAEDSEIGDVDFEEWWNAYGKKRGKEKCKKKWAKMSPRDKRACIEATPGYVASTPEVLYRKDPYTYLNNKSWNDELIFRQPTQQQQQQQRLDEAARVISSYAKEDSGNKE